MFFNTATAVLQLTTISLEYEPQQISKGGPEQAQWYQSSVTLQADHIPACQGATQHPKASNLKAKRSLDGKPQGQVCHGISAWQHQQKRGEMEGRSDSQRAASACAAIDSCKYFFWQHQWEEQIHKKHLLEPLSSQ